LYDRFNSALTSYLVEAMGIDSTQVHFRPAPTLHEVGGMFATMTSLPIQAPANEESELWLTHATHPTHPLILGWLTDQLVGQG
jgi:hypothetical protein